MKAKFIFILVVLIQVLIDVSFTANAQQANSSLSAMKDSFPAFVANSEDGSFAGADYEIPNLCPDVSSRDCSPSDALVIISKMTEQVRSNIQMKRVRVVSSDEQNAQAKKRATEKNKKRKSQS